MANPNAQKIVELDSSFSFIMIAENSSYFDSLQAGLKKLGFKNFIPFDSPLKALEYMRFNKANFVFCQYESREMQGLEVMEEMFGNLEIAKIPFVIMSSKAGKADLAYMAERGADCFLKIPVEQKPLAGLIKRLYSRYSNKNNPEFIFEQVRVALNKKKLKEAYLYAQILLKSKDPNVKGRAHLEIGRIFQRQNAIDEAIKSFQQALRHLTFKVHPHQELGSLYLQLGFMDQAVWHFNKGIEISPKNPFRYRVVGEIYIEHQKYVESLDLIKRGIRFLDDASYLNGVKADALFFTGEYEKCLPIYESIMKVNPNVSVAFLNKVAIAFKRLKKYPKAIHLYRRAMEMYPDNAELCFNYALSLFHTGKKDAAIKAVRQSIKIKPDFLKAKRYLHLMKDQKSEVDKMVVETLQSALFIGNQFYRTIGYQKEYLKQIEKVTTETSTAMGQIMSQFLDTKTADKFGDFSEEGKLQEIEEYLKERDAKQCEELNPIFKEMAHQDFVHQTINHLSMVLKAIEKQLAQKDQMAMGLFNTILDISSIPTLPSLTERYNIYFENIKPGKPYIFYLINLVKYVQHVIDYLFSQIIHAAYNMESLLFNMIQKKMNQSEQMAKQLGQVVDGNEDNPNKGRQVYAKLESIKKLKGYQTEEIKQLEQVEKVLRQNFHLQTYLEPMLNLFRFIHDQLFDLQNEVFIEVERRYGAKGRNFWEDLFQYFRQKEQVARFKKYLR